METGKASDQSMSIMRPLHQYLQFNQQFYFWKAMSHNSPYIDEKTPPNASYNKNKTEIQTLHTNSANTATYYPPHTN